jgi:hypothetical protein
LTLTTTAFRFCPFCLQTFPSNWSENRRYSGKFKFISSMHVLCMIFLSLNPHYNNLKGRSLRFFPLKSLKAIPQPQKSSDLTDCGGASLCISLKSRLLSTLKLSPFLFRFSKPPSNIAAEGLHRLAEHEMLLVST